VRLPAAPPHDKTHHYLQPSRPQQCFISSQSPKGSSATFALVSPLTKALDDVGGGRETARGAREAAGGANTDLGPLGFYQTRSRKESKLKRAICVRPRPARAVADRSFLCLRFSSSRQQQTATQPPTNPTSSLSSQPDFFLISFPSFPTNQLSPPSRKPPRTSANSPRLPSTRT
jgi:hypothetical protein